MTAVCDSDRAAERSFASAADRSETLPVPGSVQQYNGFNAFALGLIVETLWVPGRTSTARTTGAYRHVKANTLQSHVEETGLFTDQKSDLTSGTGVSFPA